MQPKTTMLILAALILLSVVPSTCSLPGGNRTVDPKLGQKSPYPRNPQSPEGQQHLCGRYNTPDICSHPCMFYLCQRETARPPCCEQVGQPFRKPGEASSLLAKKSIGVLASSAPGAVKAEPELSRRFAGILHQAILSIDQLKTPDPPKGLRLLSKKEIDYWLANRIFKLVKNSSRTVLVYIFHLVVSLME